jgi:coenzyme F420-0:L-glutamate ligase/coenzyme F420-1:gamma-L-glutamate ligase
VAERATPTHVTRVVRAHAGPVMASAGVDASNTGMSGGVLLLPGDPDRVCQDVHDQVAAAIGVADFGVVLTDTAGRPWRVGQTDFALGAYGIAVLDDLRGTADTDGRRLDVTVRALADEIAAAADLVKGKVSGRPAALVRGLADLVLPGGSPAGAGSLVRSGDADWFALGAQEAVRAALGVPPGSSAAEAVGIRPVGPGPEPRGDRVGRAVAVALATGLSASVEARGDLVEVSGTDPVDTGMVAARLLTALSGEGVPHRYSRHGSAVHVQIG